LDVLAVLLLKIPEKHAQKTIPIAYKSHPEKTHQAGKHFKKQDHKVNESASMRKTEIQLAPNIIHR